MAKSPTKKQEPQTAGSGHKLYTLDVFIMDGPMTESFLKKNKVVSRVIQIRGDQTLAELHRAIFNAFDREQEHMYEFQIGGVSVPAISANPLHVRSTTYGGDSLIK